ncbi:MAG: hypothetical protein ACYDB7_08915 [Mycobacteriales bacterium]
MEVRRTRILESDDVALVRRLRLTSVDRTIVDLCAMLGERERVALVAACVQHGRTDPAKLAVALHGWRGLPGAARLCAVLRALSPGHQSVFEAELGAWLRAGPLPTPLFNSPVVTPQGTLHPDAYWPEARVVLEAHGRAFHLGSDDWERDLARANAYAAAGLTLVAVSYRQFVADPAQLEAQLEQILRQRWAAEPRWEAVARGRSRHPRGV